MFAVSTLFSTWDTPCLGIGAVRSPPPAAGPQHAPHPGHPTSGGSWCAGIDIIELVSAPSEEYSGWRGPAVVAVSISALPVAVFWFFGGWPSPRWLIAFIIYSDVSITVCLLLKDTELTAIGGTGLFAVVTSLQVSSVTPMCSSIISERNQPGVSATAVHPKGASSCACANAMRKTELFARSQSVDLRRLQVVDLDGNTAAGTAGRTCYQCHLAVKGTHPISFWLFGIQRCHRPLTGCKTTELESCCVP